MKMTIFYVAYYEELQEYFVSNSFKRQIIADQENKYILYSLLFLFVFLLACNFKSHFNVILDLI